MKPLFHSQQCSKKVTGSFPLGIVTSARQCDYRGVKRISNRTSARTELLEQLRRLLGGDYVVDETESMRPFECDGLPLYSELPLVVALPANWQEVQAVLRLCHSLGVPVVPRGSGTIYWNWRICR